MNSFKSYLNKTNKFQYLMKKGTKYGFDWDELNGNISQQICNAMCIKNINISYIEVDMKKAFKCSSENMDKYMKKLNSDHYTKCGRVWVPFTEKIKDFVEEKINNNTKQTQYINLCIDNYNENGAVHTLILIIHNSQMFLINPHGDYSPNDQNGVTYKSTIDYIFVKNLTTYINKYADKKISFNKTNEYLGVCLQHADNYGLCYIFAYTIFYMLNDNYKLATSILTNKGIDSFIYYCFQDFNDTMKIELLKKMKFRTYKIKQERIEKSMESNMLFMKKVLNTTISFMTQKNLLKKYRLL